MLHCPKCDSTYGHCPECGREYGFSSFKLHNTKACCKQPACRKVNAPVDCMCGFVVASDCSGIIDFEGNLHKFVEKL
jgi:hypothetical protein